MTLVEYLADPDRYLSMQDVKKQVGRHVAKDRAEYDAIMKDLRFFTRCIVPQGGVMADAPLGDELRARFFAAAPPLRRQSAERHEPE